jgi:hypothetical protein
MKYGINDKRKRQSLKISIFFPWYEVKNAVLANSEKGTTFHIPGSLKLFELNDR